MINDVTILVSIRQILQIAIIPVLQQILSTVIFSLTNKDIFGYYEIAELFITGRFLEMNNYCASYHQLIHMESKKICLQLIEKNTYRTKLDISISTTRGSDSNSNVAFDQEMKCFCYETFEKGEIRIVSSSTYFVCVPYATRVLNSLKHERLGSSVTCGYSHGILIRGQELCDRTIEVKATSDIAHDKILRGMKTY